MIHLISTGVDALAAEVLFRAGALLCGAEERMERMEALIALDLDDVLPRVSEEQ